MTQNLLLNFINGTLSKEAGKEFKQAVLQKLQISEATMYRKLNDPDQFSQLEKEAIASLAKLSVNQLFTEVNQQVNP